MGKDGLLVPGKPGQATCTFLSLIVERGQLLRYQVPVQLGYTTSLNLEVNADACNKC